MRRHWPFFGVIAALVLLFGGIGSGFAHGQAPVSGWVTLCIGEHLIVTPVDEDGQPIAPGHLCPDCLVQVLPGSPTAPSLEARTTEPRDKPRATWENHRIKWAAVPPARAPPRPV